MQFLESFGGIAAFRYELRGAELHQFEVAVLNIYVDYGGVWRVWASAVSRVQMLRFT